MKGGGYTDLQFVNNGDYITKRNNRNGKVKPKCNQWKKTQTDTELHDACRQPHQKKRKSH